MVVKTTSGVLLALLFTACSQSHPTEDEAILRKTCLITAGGLAGGEVELLKFGHFAPNAPLDCVVAGILPDIENPGDGLLASRLLVLRRQAQSWRVALDAAKWAHNPEGVVGVDSIDDGYDFKGLRVVLDDKTPTRQTGITLWLTYVDENGEDQGGAKAFTLNPANMRYQEFDDKLGFKPEVKDPPHVRGK